MAVERPDWVPEGWEWKPHGKYAIRKCVDGQVSIEQGFCNTYFVGAGNLARCRSLETALAIAELLAAERGGWSEISHIALQTAHVAQLQQLGQALSGVSHGDVISKQACADLINLRLACKDSKCYYATNQGLHWLRCAEIDCALISSRGEA